MELPFALVRALHFAACLLPLSVFTTTLLVVKPAAAPGAGGWSPRGFHRLLPACCVAAAAVSGFCWFWFSIAQMSGLPLRESLSAGLFKMVLTQTQPGQVWRMRAVACLLLALAMMPGLPRWVYYIRLLLAACMAGSLAWLGHAGAVEGMAADFHLSCDVLHLLAAAVWPGGLLPFALYLGPLLQTRTQPALSAAAAATRRFSAMSMAAVGVLALSGIVNACFLVGSFHELFYSAYGRLLLLKLALFAAMIAMGAVNLLVLKPRLPSPSALNSITRNVLLELCLGAAILFVTAVLGITPPASHL